MDTSICHNAHLGESMGQHRALYQIGGISPGQKNDFTTARPLAKARDFRSGSNWEELSTIICFPLRPRTRTLLDDVGTSHLCQFRTLPGLALAVTRL